ASPGLLRRMRCRLLRWLFWRRRLWLVTVLFPGGLFYGSSPEDLPLSGNPCCPGRTAPADQAAFLGGRDVPSQREDSRFGCFLFYLLTDDFVRRQLLSCGASRLLPSWPGQTSQPR